MDPTAIAVNRNNEKAVLLLDYRSEELLLMVALPELLVPKKLTCQEREGRHRSCR